MKQIAFLAPLKLLTKPRPIQVSRKPPYVAIFILVFVIFVSIFGDLISSTDPLKVDLANAFIPPFSKGTDFGYRFLGTDNLGRDILGRMILGAKVSLVVAFSAVVVSGTLGALLGLLSGYFGGTLDAIIMRVTDLMLSLPLILIAVAIASVLGPSLRNIIIILGITNWTGYARLVRGQVLTIRERDYVKMAKVVGCSETRIILFHILPGVINSLIIFLTLDAGKVIMLESVLSFLGLGVQWPNTSWGLMIADGRLYLSTAWWLVTLPGIAISLLVLSINMLGDYLRDILPTGSLS